MRATIAACLSSVTILGCATTRPNPFRAPSFRTNVGAVVRISGTRGTGVLVSGQGYVLTCRHVVADAPSLTVDVTDDDGSIASYRAEIAGEDAANDLALLKVDDGAFPAIAPVTFADPAALRPDDEIYAAGYPLGGPLKVRAGTVTRFPFRVEIREEGLDLRDGILTSLKMDPGMSGGPVFSHGRGRLVGIHKMSLVDENGANVGAVIVSAKTIRAFLDARGVPYQHSSR